MNMRAAISVLVHPWETSSATRASWGASPAAVSRRLRHHSLPGRAQFDPGPLGVALAAELGEQARGRRGVARAPRRTGSRGVATRRTAGGSEQDPGATESARANRSRGGNSPRRAILGSAARGTDPRRLIPTPCRSHEVLSISLSNAPRSRSSAGRFGWLLRSVQLSPRARTRVRRGLRVRARRRGMPRRTRPSPLPRTASAHRVRVTPMPSPREAKSFAAAAMNSRASEFVTAEGGYQDRGVRGSPRVRRIGDGFCLLEMSLGLCQTARQTAARPPSLRASRAEH